MSIYQSKDNVSNSEVDPGMEYNAITSDVVVPMDQDIPVTQGVLPSQESDSVIPELSSNMVQQDTVSVDTHTKDCSAVQEMTSLDNASTAEDQERKAFSTQAMTLSTQVGDQSMTQSTHNNQSMTSSTHVDDQSMTSSTHVDDQPMTSSTHVDDQLLKPSTQVDDQSVTSSRHVADQPSTGLVHKSTLNTLPAGQDVSSDESESSVSSDEDCPGNENLDQILHEIHQADHKVDTEEIDQDVQTDVVYQEEVSLPSNTELKIVGLVFNTVDTLVNIKPHDGIPTLDIGSLLFQDGRKVLGQIYDIFGPVSSPYYSVKFNLKNHIQEKNIKAGDSVYFAPQDKNYTSYVFDNKYLNKKGTDASGQDDEQVQSDECSEFSDDEKERRANSTMKEVKGTKNNKKKHKNKGRKEMSNSNNNRQQHGFRNNNGAGPRIFNQRQMPSVNRAPRPYYPRHQPPGHYRPPPPHLVQGYGRPGLPHHADPYNPMMHYIEPRSPWPRPQQWPPTTGFIGESPSAIPYYQHYAPPGENLGHQSFPVGPVDSRFVQKKD